MKSIYLVPILSVASAIALGATIQRSVTVTNFNAGELSPQMEGRVDFPKYRAGARELQNMIVRSQGPVTRRPGTRYVAEVKDSNDFTRLVPFEYSTTDAYVLELGDGSLRFYRAGAQVMSGASAYEVNTPWDANDIFEIQFAQDAQYMRFVHPDYVPYKLSRNSASHTDWTLAAIDFLDGPFLDENEDHSITVYADATTGDVNLIADANIFDGNHVGALWQVSHLVEVQMMSIRFWANWTELPVWADEEGDGTYEANSPTVTVYEHQSYSVTTGGDWYGVIIIQRSYDDGATWDGVKAFASVNNQNILYTGVEENEDALYRVRIEDQQVTSRMKSHDEGECDVTLSTDPFMRHGTVLITDYNDANEVQGTVQTELASTDATWRWAEGAWSDYRGWPRAIEHHEQRCLYAGTDSWPQTVWASIVSSQDGDYDDFDIGLGDAADAWMYVLPGQNPVQWMVSAEYLMIGTSEGVGRMGWPDRAITPEEAPVWRVNARNGCAYLDAVAAVDAILYVERGGEHIREVSYTYAEDRYVAPDMSILAEHIAVGGITQIDFAERPDPILWCVRGDGVLLSFTYQRKQEVLAWARHITGQDANDLTSWDEFESIAIIPGASTRADGVTRTDDELWAVVKRTVDSNEVRYVEQFQALDWGDDPNYCWFVDCAGWGTSSAGSGETLTQGVQSYSYTYTLITENGYLWFIPVSGRELVTLDAGSAVNVGGGIVGLPCTGNPFESGAVVYLEGTTNYDGQQTLTAGTTTSQLQFADIFVAETFAGTETVIRRIALEEVGNGSVVKTDANVYYYGHVWDTGKATMVSTLSETFVESVPTLAWLGTETGTHKVADLVLSDDELYLYVLSYVGTSGRVYRFRLSDGVLMWSTAVTMPGYDLAVDSSGNAYVGRDNYDARKFAVADGAATNLTDMEDVYLHVHVDNDNSLLIAGGYQYDLTVNIDPAAPLYNFAVRTLDDSAGDQAAVGGTYVSGALVQTRIISKGCVAIRNSYIYVLIQIGSPASSTIYKYYWTGSELTFISSAAGPTYGIGLFFDPWGNLVVVNQDVTLHQDDLLWFYNSELNYLSKLEGLYDSMLLSWDSAVGGTYLQGEHFFGGVGLGGGVVGGDVNDNWSGLTWGVGLTECAYADGRPLDGTYTVDANGVVDLGAEYDVVIVGLNYYSILETMPLVDAETIGRPINVKSIAVDFIETMGAHVGADMENSADWTFSDDDFATSMQPFTGYKPQMGYAGFLRGTSRQPVVYIYEWDPVPMTIRSITANLEVTIE